MSYRLIVFDWDGTLMDSANKIVASAQAAIRELSMPQRQDEAIREIIGLGLPEAVERLYPGKDHAFQHRFIERYRHHFLTADNTPMSLFDGAADCLHGLYREGYLLAVATGKSRAGLERSLRETGLGELFAAGRCADEAFSKPHPQMLQDILDELVVEPTEALMVGDTEYDLQMAKSAGVDALGVSYGVHSCERLLKCAPLACLDAITELPEWLNKRGGQAKIEPEEQ